MSGYKGGEAAALADETKLRDFEERADPNDKEQQALIQEMRKHTDKLAAMRKSEDPRLSFCTPDFREAQRAYAEAFKKNFSQPITHGLVKRYPWQAPVLTKLDVAVDPTGKPWPVDADGKLILTST